MHREICPCLYHQILTTYLPLDRTSGENIGDTGLIQSYRAWKAQYEESYDAGNEYLLPGLNYTRYVKFGYCEVHGLNDVLVSNCFSSHLPGFGLGI